MQQATRPGAQIAREQQSHSVGQAPYSGPGWYRVQGDWFGGGFGYTLHFASHADAMAWGRAKARFHPDAQLSITLREADGEPGDLTEAEVAAIAADLSYNQAKSDGSLRRREEALALDAQVQRFNLLEHLR